MKRLVFVLVVMAVFIGAGKFVTGSAQESAQLSPQGEPGARELVFTTDAESSSPAAPEQHQALGAQAGAAGTGWYRDEYGRLFSINEHRHNVILMSLRWGYYPTRILAADQEALALSDLALEAMGYTATENGDWEQE